MKRSYHLWILALLVAAAFSVLQRMTGPTLPKHFVTLLDSTAVEVILDRAHYGSSDHVVRVETSNDHITGSIEWKNIDAYDSSHTVSMEHQNGILSGAIPGHTVAQKIHYTISLTDGKQTFTASTVLQFRGEIPYFLLDIHIVVMFFGMLFAARTGLELFVREPIFHRLVYSTSALILFGGLILGPLVQHYAFNAGWNGFPAGYDITTNKTLIASLGWCGASIAIYRKSDPKRWVMGILIVTVLVYIIPHSL